MFPIRIEDQMRLMGCWKRRAEELEKKSARDIAEFEAVHCCHHLSWVKCSIVIKESVNETQD